MEFVSHCYQEFISFCEAMELVPKDELESSVQATGNTFPDKRAKKVDFDFYLGSRILYMTIL